MKQKQTRKARILTRTHSFNAFFILGAHPIAGTHRCAHPGLARESLNAVIVYSTGFRETIALAAGITRKPILTVALFLVIDHLA